MQLLLPQVVTHGLESGIVHARIVAVHNPLPDLFAILGGMVRTAVKFVLEAIDASHPREQPNDIFEFAFDTPADSLGVIAVERLEVACTDEFHTHARDFGKFRRHVAVSQNRLVCKRILVERMTRFMQQRVNVAVRFS